MFVPITYFDDGTVAYDKLANILKFAAIELIAEPMKSLVTAIEQTQAAVQQRPWPVSNQLEVCPINWSAHRVMQEMHNQTGLLWQSPGIYGGSGLLDSVSVSVQSTPAQNHSSVLLQTLNGWLCLQPEKQPLRCHHVLWKQANIMFTSQKDPPCELWTPTNLKADCTIETFYLLNTPNR